MKRFLMPLLFGFLALGAAAQGKGKDYVTLKQDGHMYWMRSGQTIKLAIPVPLKNGSTAYPDGSVQTKDGDLSRLNQGDRILMDGTLVSRRKGK